MKQIRLLENQAKTDSIKVIELTKALDTLHTVVYLKEIRLNKCDTIQMLQNQEIELQKTLLNINQDKLAVFELKKLRLKKQVRNRTIIIVASAILNSLFIIKTLQ